ncbi:MAG TPA: prepilin peptidase [Gemmatimonadales bacterium]|nr:prepilin peptidase [Gemmatimonadales bacterium]
MGAEELAALGPVPAIFFGVLGLLFGSFLNVCIVRWGAEPKQSVVRPRSRCPKCGHEISWYENVPVFSWLALRGRCKGCGNPISPMYPMVELAVGLLWAWMAWRHGVTLQALAHAVFGTLLLGIALTDARAFIIPHEFTLGGTIIALALAFLQGVPTGLAASAGALFGAGLILLVGEVGTLAFRRAAMGGGDVALMGLVGAFLGWQSVIAVVALGAVVSLVLHVASAALHRAPAASTTSPGDEGGGISAALLGGAVLAAVVLVAVMIVLMRAGLLGEALTLLRRGTMAAGVLYYVGFALPDAVVERTAWLQVGGLLALCAVVAAWPPVSPVRLAAGAGALGLTAWAARRVPTAEPEAADDADADTLRAQGYLPFGVGLAIAAFVLGIVIGAPAVDAAFADYARSIGL